MTAFSVSDKASSFMLSTGIFMCLMLPFASLLLWAPVKLKLGRWGLVLSTVTLLGAIPVALAVLAPSAQELFERRYMRFIHKDGKYFAEIARACDQLLVRHPVGGDNYVSLTSNNKSLPSIIRELGTADITVASNHVTILVGEGRPELGISWHPESESNASVWQLRAFCENGTKVVYVESRP